MTSGSRASDQLTRLLALQPGLQAPRRDKSYIGVRAVIRRRQRSGSRGLPGGMHGDFVDFDAADFEAGARLSEPLKGWTARVRLTRRAIYSAHGAQDRRPPADGKASAPSSASTQRAGDRPARL